MIEQLRAAFLPRIEFEQRNYRRHLALRAGVAYLIVVTFWLLSVIGIRLFGTFPASNSLATNILGIGCAGLTGTIALFLVRRDRIIAAGYLLATTCFAIGTITVLFSPNAIAFTSASMLLGTILAGAIVGGAAGYLYAVSTILVTLVGWFSARAYGSGGIGTQDPHVAVIFILSVSVTSLATAAILQSLTRQVERTINRLHSQAERLYVLANTDPLTQLANRRNLLNRLQQEFDRARRYHRPLSLLYIDLDGFKGINDQFGHLFGDDVLRGVATAMQGVLRTTDLLARIGGDEFAVLLPETTMKGAENAAEKLRRALSAFSERLGPEVPKLSFCGGISNLSPDDESIEALLRRADEAQYLAKATGKGKIQNEEDVRNYSTG
ncbi:MAG: diguanylate cyclase [Anaerolineales bacterium]